MKVLKNFYCSKEQKSYKKGDNYTGKRKDLKGYVSVPKKAVNKK